MRNHLRWRLYMGPQPRRHWALSCLGATKGHLNENTWSNLESSSDREQRC